VRFEDFLLRLAQQLRSRDMPPVFRGEIFLRASKQTCHTREALMRLRGFEAIEYAEKEGLRLNKAADSVDDAMTNLTIAEAEAIASDNPELIWVDVPQDEYYGDRINMESER